jgi:hypothetical protein
VLLQQSESREQGVPVCQHPVHWAVPLLASHEVPLGQVQLTLHVSGLLGASKQVPHPVPRSLQPHRQGSLSVVQGAPPHRVGLQLPVTPSQKSVAGKLPPPQHWLLDEQVWPLCRQVTQTPLDVSQTAVGARQQS